MAALPDRDLTAPKCAAVALAAAIASWSAPGSASELFVECAALGAEDSAALSARLRADLEVRRASGRMMVTCSTERLWVAWVPNQGAARQEAVELGNGETPNVEHAFEAADRLFSDTSLWPSAPAPTPAPVADERPPEPPRPAEPVVIAESPRAAEPDAPAPGLALLALAPGAEIELWSSEVTAAFGPYAAVVLAPRDWLALSAAGGLRFALDEPNELSANTIDARIGGDAALLEGRLWLGAGLRITHLRVRSTALSDLEDSATPVALEVRARGSFGRRSLRLVGGPFLGIRPGATVVRLDDSEQFRIPIVSVGLTLEAQIGVLSR